MDTVYGAMAPLARPIFPVAEAFVGTTLYVVASRWRKRTDFSGASIDPLSWPPCAASPTLASTSPARHPSSWILLLKKSQSRGRGRGEGRGARVGGPAEAEGRAGAAAPASPETPGSSLGCGRGGQAKAGRETVLLWAAYLAVIYSSL